MRTRRRYPRWVASVAGVGMIVSMVALTAPLAATPSGAATNHVVQPAPCIGQLRLASHEPGKVLPLGPNTLHGYTRTYCNDFSGTAIPAGWFKFKGQPRGDANSMFEPWHVRIRGGALRINTYRDPLLKWKWVSGGICQCGLARTYGAYYIRARITAPGASAIALLWPKNNSWPPEVDFLETWQQYNSSTSTLHFSIRGNPGDHKVQDRVKMNLTAWHTWGVTWAPNYIKFTVGKYVYWTITNRTEIPRLVMTLDLQQQSWCGIFLDGCPIHASSMLIDWVVEFVPNQFLHAKTTRVRPSIPSVANALP